MPIISRLVKGVGSGIGLAFEANAHNEDKNLGYLVPDRNVHVQRNETDQVQACEEVDDDSNSDVDEESGELNDDHVQWALDEAAAELEARSPESKEDFSESLPEQPEDKIAHSFLKSQNLRPTAQSYRPLPYPVILPQRRPKDKSRGFIRAYAPILNECSNIDQTTFLDMLESLDRSSKAAPVFDVINLACLAVGFIPNPITIGVSIAVQVASSTAKEIQSRSRRNNFLDKMNDELFKPRGLYCMIMTFQPDYANVPVVHADLSSTEKALIRATSTPDSRPSQAFKNMRLTSGVTTGEIALPEAAPLVYPSLDVAAVNATHLSAQKQQKLKGSRDFIARYLDRRAQDTYMATDSLSKLATATPPSQTQYASRFSDANHPANSGTILGLLTGGTYDPRADRRVRRAERRARKRGEVMTEEQTQNVRMGRRENVGAGGRRRRERKGPVRAVLQKVLHQDLLYLTVVNLPSEGEMREMRREVRRMGGLE